MRKRIIITALCLLASTVHAFGAPKVDMKSYEKDGMRYIEKTYVIDTDADLSDVADGTFELDGYSYSQIDIKSQPVIHKEKKEVCQTKNVLVPSQGAAGIFEKIGKTLEYTDETGFSGKLEPDLNHVRYQVTGYTHKTMTKNGSQMFYNLPSMDTAQIPKSIWRDGIRLSLIDVQWIGDNRFASADTDVGNNYAAKGIYQGTYQVNIPSGYKAEVLYKGVAEKEISEQTAYTVTYVGEMLETSFWNKVSVPFLIGFCLLDALVLLLGVVLYFKHRRKRQAAMEKEWPENEKEVMKEQNQGEVDENAD